ncbi:MAG: carbohydrate kinase, partial [Bacteroidales bacterium]|nr:carbohydrate kinase [Bacteroidales bacterium]
MKKTVTGIGEVVWDMLPGGPVLGGAPLNFAFVASELGCSPSIISAVGWDDLSEKTLARIREIGIDISLIQRNSLPTSRVNIELDEAGIPHYEICEDVSWDALDCTEREKSAVAKSDAVCWGSLAQRSPRSRAAILSMLDSARKDCL